MKQTDNYNFPVPEDDDFWNVNDFADMMIRVDEVLAKVEKAGGIYMGGPLLSEEATIEDTTAEYTVLRKSSSKISDIPLFNCEADVKMGTYAIMIRAKVSDVSKTENLIRLKIKKGSAGDVIKEVLISPDVFEKNNKYKVIGTVVEFSDIKKGTKMCIEASVIKTTASETITVDYVLINPAYTSISAI